MKKILVPVDFSEVSKNALKYAAELAAHFHAELLVMHAYLPSLPEPYLVAAFQDDLELEQSKLADKYFEDIHQSLPESITSHINIEFKTELGGAVECILKVAESWEADMTVMGMRSGNPVAKKLFGSTTSGVIQRLQSPLLVVPAEAKFQPISSVLYASELESSELPTINLIKTYFADWAPEVTCVHVADHQGIVEDLKLSHMKKLMQDSAELSNVSFASVRHDDVSEGLMAVAERKRVQLITMQTHLRTFWGRLFYSSHSKDLARKTSLPLLIFPMATVND